MKKEKEVKYNYEVHLHEIRSDLFQATEGDLQEKFEEGLILVSVRWAFIKASDVTYTAYGRPRG